MKVKVLIPAHISGFWYLVKSEDPLATGTLGAGLTLEPGLEVEGTEGCCVEYNGSPIALPTYFRACNLANVKPSGIKVKAPYYLGEGYGASAGITLGGLYFSFIDAKIRRTWIELGKYAHVAEVMEVTGYGDVITEIFGGGLEIRLVPGGPGIGVVDRIPVEHDVAIITSSIYKMSTSEMFLRYGERINTYGKAAYDKFIRNPSLERFVECSYEFSVNTGMLSEDLVAELMPLIKAPMRRGYIYGYFVKKGLMVIVCDKGYLSEVEGSLGSARELKVFDINYSGITIKRLG